MHQLTLIIIPFCLAPLSVSPIRIALSLLSLSPRAQTFIKTVNYNHLMPTRYTLDLDLKNVAGDVLENTTKKVDARKVILWRGNRRGCEWGSQGLVTKTGNRGGSRLMSTCLRRNNCARWGGVV